MVKENNLSPISRFIIATSILVGTCIGAGILGIPYVSAQSGFFVSMGYIIILGLVMMLINLYLGEVSLRTVGNHQIPGYAKRYLNKTGRRLASFAMIFGIYSAIVAYMLGMGESLSFILFGSLKYTTITGMIIGLGMAWLLWGGIDSLKKYEKIGVGLIIFLILFIFAFFIGDVQISNLTNLNMDNFFLPFGVVLFALMSFQAVPEVRLILHKNEKMMKSILITSILITILIYLLFTFVVVGSQGLNTPDVATLALGGVFILFGFLTIFTSYLALGNALIENFIFDDKMKKKKAWFFGAIAPIFIFIFVRSFNYFSFTKILGWGGVISAGMMGILILLMVRNAKKKGDRKPEYKLPVNWFIIFILGLLFLAGILAELGLFG